MSHITIHKNEFVFLKENILKKYSELSGYDFHQFQKQLTGTIGIYEDIAKIMCNYFENENIFHNYYNLLKEGSLKISMNKINNKPEETIRFLGDLKSYLTANVLRKLIYPKPEEQELTFKEQFITACYFYINYDRINFLREYPIEIINQKDKTKSFSNVGDVEIKETQHIYSKEPSFLLKALNDENKIDEERKTLKFNGNLNTLNRGNLDPENSTITRKIQAEISYQDGKWFIENKSQMYTTFILVNKKTKIEKGDIIVMGNKKFLFE